MKNILLIFVIISSGASAQKVIKPKQGNIVKSNFNKNYIPETGISGLYEVMVGVNENQKDEQIKYWNEYGFFVTDSSDINAAEALKLYGVNSDLQSYRMQNGDIDSHGLLRLLVWNQPTGIGVNYAESETIGQRMSVMKTKDIMRIADVYNSLRDQQKKWHLTQPFFDDPLRINKNGEINFFKRPVGVRENMVFGELFIHVFFQRYGYEIPGYGTINDKTNLKTSEFTHNDFVIKVDSMQQLMYLQYTLGLKAEKEPEIDGDWLKGARETFNMKAGYSHWYQGFVSPNNICGKLKFFAPRGIKPDFSKEQKLGALGITLHSFYTPNINMIYNNVLNYGLIPTEILNNEFGEKSFVFKGPEGASWQIIERLQAPKNAPATKTIFEWVNN